MPGEFVRFTRIPVVVVVAVVALEVRRGDVLEGTRFGFRELIEDSFCTPIRLWVGQCVCVTADNGVRLRGGIIKEKDNKQILQSSECVQTGAWRASRVADASIPRCPLSEGLISRARCNQELGHLSALVLEEVGCSMLFYNSTHLDFFLVFGFFSGFLRLICRTRS